jgi:pimeloyl-ACP methyl ester carboxylesterase
MSNPYLLDIRPIGPQDHPRSQSYVIASTAPVNVEQLPCAGSGGDPQIAIQAMVEFILTNSAIGEVEILIQIHGYNMAADYVDYRYQQTAAELAHNYPSDRARLFLGYRWPSEPINTVWSDSIKLAQSALPQLLRLVSQSSKLGLLMGLIGLVFGLLLVRSEGVRFVVLIVGFVLVLLLAVGLGIPIVTLLALRLSNYFRDVHRAEHYGVLDLIEFMRQLDRAVMHQVDHQWQRPRIRLSFVGHSMGAFVVTQVVRILSDVFDTRSIATLDMTDRTAPPPSEVGNIFRLGRLVLVAPDISTESIISGRGNTLRSAIRRFEEAYVFCNEGDIALRLASTVANYFSFPAATREGGFRLGAITLRPPVGRAATPAYGVLNLLPNGKLADRAQFLDCLSIRPDFSVRQRQAKMWGHDGASPPPDRKAIAELFTYFDCTDYQEWVVDPKTGKSRRQGLLGLAEGKANLGYWDLWRLTIAMAQGKVDPHGGYLRDEAKFCNELIFGLGCLGFAGLLDRFADRPEYLAQHQQVCQMYGHLQPTQQQRIALLTIFSQLNADRGIQVLLSPERYNVEVLAGKPNRCGY